MYCRKCGQERGMAKYCRHCGADQVTHVGNMANVQQPKPESSQSLRRYRIFIQASVFTLVLLIALIAIAIGTAVHWTAIDVPEQPETFHDEEYLTGKYFVTMDDINPCYVGQDWTDCINEYIDEYNRECTKPLEGSRLAASRSTGAFLSQEYKDMEVVAKTAGGRIESSVSLCARYKENITEMQEKDRPGSYVSSLGSLGQLHSSPQSAKRQVSNNDYRPAVTHEAVCYFGVFGECPE